MKMKDMCRLIEKADLFEKPLTAEEIFNYSSTGELSQIWSWFFDAAKQLYMENRLDNKDRELIRDFFKEI